VYHCDLQDATMTKDPAARTQILREMTRIRRFEETVLRLFGENRLFGTTHTCIGQEACAVAVLGALDRSRDVVFSNHRCHGHFLMYGGDMARLLAELMGRRDGVCGGRGGSQHLCYRNFYTNGIQGGIVPLAVGAALAEKRRKTGAIVCVFLGDGTLGQGVVYESLNIASKWQLPVLFVIEFNDFAQTTPAETTLAGRPENRARAFGVESDTRADEDPLALSEHMRQVAARVRETGAPFLQVLATRRLAPHSKGDDTRPPEMVEELWRSDVLTGLQRQLPQARVQEIEREIEAALRRALGTAEAAPRAHWEDSDQTALAPPEASAAEHSDPRTMGGSVKVVHALNAALHEILSERPEAFVVGEDVRDPYGGAFKVTRRLSTEFPDQVLPAPISEAAIVGLSVGAALRGMLPVPEIMFGDFLTLAADQIVNHAAKFHWMYDHQVTVPVTIRTPMGGRRGYGATHSQSIEKMFLGVPGLRTIAIHRRHDPAKILKFAVVHDPNPVLFIEHKLLYGQSVDLRPPQGFEAPEVERAPYPTLVWRPAGGVPADFTLVTYGYNADIAEEAIDQLFSEHEWLPEYVLMTQLSPLRPEPILTSVARTQRLVVVEEGGASFGFGSEVLAAVAQAADSQIKARSVGAKDFPIPCARNLEDSVLPASADVVSAVCEIMKGG